MNAHPPISARLERTVDYRPPAPAPFTPHVRPMRADELPWVVHSWSEGYKGSPSMARKTWHDYKALEVPVLRAALARPDTTLLVAAEPGGRGVGWLAFARWPSIDAVHWVYVTMRYRRRGVMRALLAGLRNNIVYTHKGAIRRGPPRADVWITALLRAQGKTVSHLPYAEWSKP